jgi:hypothetical protein
MKDGSRSTAIAVVSGGCKPPLGAEWVTPTGLSVPLGSLKSKMSI